MGVASSNPCPKCGKIPDIPGDLALQGPIIYGIHRARSQCFCNNCGVRLGVTLTQIEPYMKGIWLNDVFSGEINPGMTASKFSSEHLEVELWDTPRGLVFVSYAHKNDSWCKPFAEHLKQAGFDVFFDNGSIGFGADWVKAIGEAVEACHSFIAILTPDSWASSWVEREINIAFAARKEILPVLLKDTNLTGVMRALQWIDVRGKSPEEGAALVAPLLKK